MRDSVALILLFAAAGCAPARPRLAVPPAVTSVSWPTPIVGPSAAAIGQDFWMRFGSPTLPALISEGLRANASLDAARARIGQARAQVRAARAALLPTVGSTVGLSQTKTDNSGASEYAYSVGSASLDVAYDVDLFGGARAGKRAAVARYDAARLDAVAAGLVIETDIARNYVALATLDDRLALSHRLIANARTLLRIVDIRQREGAATRLDHGLQAVEVAKLEAQRAQIDQARRATLAALAVLVGREAPQFEVATGSAADLLVPAIDPGQPGDLMFRRPDILAAEARIAGADGDVAQARAAFLPSLRLSASALGQAVSVAGPFGLTLVAGQSLFAPIFQGGRLKARYEQASAAQVEVVAFYRQALLEALQEGSTALSAVVLSDGRVATLAAAVGEAQGSIALSKRQYLDGAVDLTTVLDAERNEAQLEDALSLARQERLTAAIDVYKALGGAPADR